MNFTEAAEVIGKTCGVSLGTAVRNSAEGDNENILLLGDNSKIKI